MMQHGTGQGLAICIAKPVARSIASSFSNISLKNVLKIFWKNFLGDPTFSSSPNTTPRSAINFTTETKRCRQRRFPILFALIDLTGYFSINSSVIY